MTPDQVASIPGLQYIQIPQDAWKWWAGMNAHARLSIEHWPGYVDTATKNLDLSSADVKTLLAQGWTREDLEYWVRLHPPDGPQPPARRTNGRSQADTFILDPILTAMERAVVQAYPEMASRAAKAVALVAGGHVTTTLGQHNYHITSQGTPGRTYHASIPPDNRPSWSCTIVQDPKTRHSHLPCPDLQHRAPHLKHGRRCKHLIAAWMYAQLQQKKAPAGQHPVEAPHTPASTPEPVHSTTAPPIPQNGTRKVVAHYADGRPARYSDGTIVRYTAGGRPVELPAGSW